MSLSGSVSIWIDGVKAGCESAAARLWTLYRSRLVQLARRRIIHSSTAVADEEDIAIEAFHSFLRRCREGQFHDVQHRDDLTKLLFAIIIRKANNHVRHQRRRCRDDRRTQQEQAGKAQLEPFELNQLLSPDPPPELVASLSDSLNRLFSLLRDAELRSMVLYRLEGRSNSEIAELTGRSEPTVERRMRLVRKIWLEEVDSLDLDREEVDH